MTKHGQAVLAATASNPYEPSGYLQRVSEKVVHADATVMAYLAESLSTFQHGNCVAATVMLGIAAERVFLLLSDSLIAALASPAEQKAFAKILEDLDIGFVPYSPLGEASSREKITEDMTFDGSDFRNILPRFYAGGSEIRPE